MKKSDGPNQGQNFNHLVPNPYRRDPSELTFYKHGVDALDKFDGFIRLGKQRHSMIQNRNISGPHIDVGMQPPPGCHLPPRNYRYGIVGKKGIYDNVPACMDEWQKFDTDRQLRMYAKEHRKRDNIAANMRALDCKISDPKNWNRFCMAQKDLFYFTPEHTQQSFKESRKVKVPKREERTPPIGESMVRILSNDYAREWYRNKFAEAHHAINIRQIDARVLGTKMNADHAAHLALGQLKLKRRLAGRKTTAELKPLAAITPPKRIREAPARLCTFREKGWTHTEPDKNQWRCAVPTGTHF